MKSHDFGVPAVMLTVAMGIVIDPLIEREAERQQVVFDLTAYVLIYASAVFDGRYVADGNTFIVRIVELYTAVCLYHSDHILVFKKKQSAK